jgi:hypothetical protein
LSTGDYENFDYAIIKLKHEITNINSLILNVLACENSLNKDINIVASPTHFIKGDGLKRKPTEKFSDILIHSDKFTLCYKKDIGSGTAGSPIFLNIEGLYSLIGLHYGDLVKQDDINHNENMLFDTPNIEKFQCGLRVTDEMLRFINLHT